MQLFKKLNFIIFCLFVFSASAQQVNILSFNVKPVLPADVNSWTTIPAAIILVVQPQNSNSPLVKPVFTIKQGGTKVCGNSAGSTIL